MTWQDRCEAEEVLVSLHVTVGKIDKDEDVILIEAAGSGDEVEWTVPRRAMPDDRILFFILSPEQRFLAEGVIRSAVQPGTSSDGKGSHLAWIGEVRLLPRPLTRHAMVDAVPGWGWPKQPHTAATVPVEHETAVLSALH